MANIDGISINLYHFFRCILVYHNIEKFKKQNNFHCNTYIYRGCNIQ